MEVVQVNNSGLFEVRLGGVVISNCTKDADCPGRAYCGLNQTWASLPSMCYCDFIYDHTGAQCETLTSDGWFYYVIHIFACFISVFAFLVGMYDLFRLIKWRQLKRDALSTSLIFAILGTFWTALLTGTATRFAVQFVTPDANGSKQDTSAIGRVTTVFVFLFSTICMLNVSLVWIEIAENAQKMQRSENNNVDRYRKFLAGYYFFYMVLIISSLAVNNFIVAAAAAIPGVLFIIVTYMLGFFRMRKMLMLYLSSDAASKDSSAPAKITSSKEATRKVRQSLRSIQWAALGLSFCALSFILTLGIWIVFGGFVNLPNSGFNLIPLSLSWISVASGNAVVVDYVHASINRKVEALANSSANHSIVVMDTYSDTPKQVTQDGSFKMHSRKPSQEASTLGTSQLSPSRPSIVKDPGV